jgi:hypothetical protein
MKVARNAAGKVTSIDIRREPFPSSEQVRLFSDGWIAIARLDPYLVEWRSPDGRVVRGSPLPYGRVKVDDAEKRAYMAAIAAANSKTPEPPDSRNDWPATIPPFPEDALLAAPNGSLFIARSKTAAAPTLRYDVIDRRGVLTGQLTLPANERLVAFGAKSAYVVVTDDDGIQRVRRHPYP